MRADLDNNKEKIIELLRQGVPRMEVCRIYACRYSTLKIRLDAWQVSLKNPQRKGIKHLEVRKSVNYYLGLNKAIISSHRLKIKLI